MKNKVRIYRKGHGLTQEQLADIVGVSRQTIHLVEKGKFSPSIELAFDLARHFHTSVEELFVYDKEVEEK